MKIHLIAALTEEGVIGNSQGLPWHIADDLRRFKKITSGKTILMGRKTFDTIGRPLPNRLNMVLDHEQRAIDGAQVYGSLPEALKDATVAGEDLYVIGGANVYAQMLPKVDIMHLSHVKKDYPGDVYFPDYDRAEWEESEREEFDEFVAVTYKRKIKKD